MAYSGAFHTTPLPLLPRTPSPLKKYSGMTASKATFDYNCRSSPSPTSFTSPIPIPLPGSSTRIRSSSEMELGIPSLAFYSPSPSPSPSPSGSGSGSRSSGSFSVPSESGDHNHDDDHRQGYGTYYASINENNSNNTLRTLHPTLLTQEQRTSNRRHSILSDSEISVLDLGPSLSPTVSTTGDAEGVPAPSLSVGMEMSPVGCDADGAEDGPVGGFREVFEGKEKRGLEIFGRLGVDGADDGADYWGYGYGHGCRYGYGHGHGHECGGEGYYRYGGCSPDGASAPNPLFVRLERDGSRMASHEHRHGHRHGQGREHTKRDQKMNVSSPVLRPLRTTRKDKARRAISSLSRRALGL